MRWSWVYPAPPRSNGWAWALIAFNSFLFLWTTSISRLQFAQGKYPGALAGVFLPMAMIVGIAASLIEQRIVRWSLYGAFLVLNLMGLSVSQESIRLLGPRQAASRR